MVVRFVCAVSLMLLGCRGSTSGGATPPSSGAAGPGARDGGACSPAKLNLGASAHVVPSFRLPEGCQPTSTGGNTPPNAIRSEEEFARGFVCKSGVGSGVDFGQYDLLVSARLLSPAQTGVEVVDDGKKVTLVSLMRSPCRADYPPMPMSYTVAFLLPHGADRAFAEAACSFPPDCGR